MNKTWISLYILYQKDESFYTVSWACDADGRPLLVAGGINGIIRVIDAGNEKIHKVTFFTAQPFAVVVKNKDLIEIFGLWT